MSKNIVVRPEQFQKAVYKALAEYGDDVLEKTDEIAKNTARQTSSTLKATNAGGKFARGWSRRSQKSTAWGTSQVVYNREYQLVHLMEYPHATGGGGYYPKNVDYTGQIARVEEEYTNKFMEEVLSKL